jgi:hypothetical protein
MVSQQEENAMKRKGHPNIPDFSSKRTAPPAASDNLPKPKQKAAPVVKNKPHSASKTSGHRGG